MTKQICDRLFYDDQETYINQNLLSRYYRIYPEKYIKPKYSISGLWKGYKATFEILNNLLFVKK
jgi:hypothetical protein